MSSRSNSPRPPPSNHRSNNGPESNVGTLSTDALYAPLSTYAADCSSKQHDDASSNTPSKKKSAHSLSLQTNSSLRESSLITFLTSMSQNLKTTHPQEYQLYRGMGGSIARFGMGDNDRASNSMRGVLEGKLLNRSLILVVGGVHNKNGRSSGGEANSEMSDVSLVMAPTTSGGKRERKRVGGNGIFGCVSNKKRKRILNQLLLDEQSKRNGKCELESSDGDGSENVGAPQEEGQHQTVEAAGESKKLQGANVTPADVREKVGSMIETLHEMWINYIHQLLLPIKQRVHTVATPSTDSPSSLALADRKQISLLLANAEHVGMPITIVKCPSRRHLLHSRCIVVNETKETWKIAMIKSKKRIPKKDGKQEERSKMLHSCKGGDADGKAHLSSHLWKIVMVPKRGTVLEVDLPWESSYPPKAISKGCLQMKNRNITVRLET